MELVDVADSKSAGGDTVWVRVPPPAPAQKSPSPLRFRLWRKLRYDGDFFAFRPQTLRWFAGGERRGVRVFYRTQSNLPGAARFRRIISMCMVDVTKILHSGSPGITVRLFGSMELLDAVVKMERQRPCVETESRGVIFLEFLSV